MTDQLTDLDLLSHQCLPYLKRSSLELLLHIHDAHQGVSSAVLPLRSVELDRDKTTVRDECGSAGIRLWDEPTAGVNDQTLKTRILQELVALLPVGQATTAHASAPRRLRIGYIATRALLLVMMYVTGTKVLADPTPQQSCDISPALLHSGCWRGLHPPGNVSSAPSISPPSSRRYKLCSWHLPSSSDEFLEPPRGSYH